jgi:hypothetical protein
MHLDDLCIRWFMSYGHRCRRWFLRSLWSKTFLSTWALFSMVMVLWAFFNSHKPTAVNCACCMRQGGDVRNSRLISCTWTQFLQLDSGRQQQFSWLSSEGAASNAHALFTTERRGGRGGLDFRKPALSTGHCKWNALSWSYSYLYATFLRFIFHIFSIISRGTIGARGNLRCWGGGGDRTRNIKNLGPQRISYCWFRAALCSWFSMNNFATC